MAGYLHSGATLQEICDKIAALNRPPDRFSGDANNPKVGRTVCSFAIYEVPVDGGTKLLQLTFSSQEDADSPADVCCCQRLTADNKCAGCCRGYRIVSAFEQFRPTQA
jgi:hypothetical protein